MEPINEAEEPPALVDTVRYEPERYQSSSPQQELSPDEAPVTSQSLTLEHTVEQSGVTVTDSSLFITEVQSRDDDFANEVARHRMPVSVSASSPREELENLYNERGYVSDDDIVKMLRQNGVPQRRISRQYSTSSLGSIAEDKREQEMAAMQDLAMSEYAE